MGEKTALVVTGGAVLAGGVVVTTYGAYKMLKKLKEKLSDPSKVNGTLATLVEVDEPSQDSYGP
jgi:hypothetical protein